MPEKSNKMEYTDEWWYQNVNQLYFLGKTDVRTLQAMREDGGKNIPLDAAFLEKHGIVHAPIDKREDLTQLRHFGLIRQDRNGWSLTARGLKWLDGTIKIKSGVEIDREDGELCGYRSFSVSIDDIINAEPSNWPPEPTHVEP